MDNKQINKLSLSDKIGIYKVSKIKKQFISQIKLPPSNEAEIEINNKTEKLFKRKVIYCEVSFFRNLMITFIAIILTIVPFLIDVFLTKELAKTSTLSADNIALICYIIGGIFALLTLGMTLWTIWAYLVKKYILANKNKISLLDETNIITTNENKIMPDQQILPAIPPANIAFQNKNGAWFYHDGLGNYFTTNSSNEWIPSSIDIALS